MELRYNQRKKYHVDVTADDHVPDRPGTVGRKYFLVSDDLLNKVDYAGIDTPPYESGDFRASNRKITKRGSASLRKTGYEIMQALKIAQQQNDNAVYQYLIKKENEEKPLKVAKIAALNSF